MTSQERREAERLNMITVLLYVRTMLQIFSKCEVYAKNFMIFLPFRFYVKSFFGNFGVSKTIILTIPLALNFDFLEFLQNFKPVFLPNPKSWPSKTVKIAVFGDLNFAKNDFLPNIYILKVSGA